MAIRIQDKERKVYIGKVKRFARSKKGQAIIRRFVSSEIIKLLEEHPEYLDIHQFYSDPRVCGNYLITLFEDKDWYTGESGNVLLRACEHIYNMLTSDCFGGIIDKNVPARIEVIAWGVTDPKLRRLFEACVVEARKPYMQFTDPASEEYGSDKFVPEGENRETLRADATIKIDLRRKRFEQAKKQYLEKLKEH